MARFVGTVEVGFFKMTGKDEDPLEVGKCVKDLYSESSIFAVKGPDGRGIKDLFSECGFRNSFV